MLNSYYLSNIMELDEEVINVGFLLICLQVFDILTGYDIIIKLIIIYIDMIGLYAGIELGGTFIKVCVGEVSGDSVKILQKHIIETQ